MSSPYIGEVRMFAGNFAPKNYAACNGQLLPIQQNTALFSLLGTVYGGDGRTTFGLPNLQGRVPIHPGQGPGLSQYTLGQSGGEASHTLSVGEMPAHTHTLYADAQNAITATATNNLLGKAANRAVLLYGPTTSTAPLGTNAVSPNSGGQSHENRQPFQVIYYIIALSGIFPQRP